MSPKAPKTPKAPKEPAVKDEAEVTCPVCAGIVTLDDPFCPHCGAEFEEEEVEEILDEEIPTIEAVPDAPESEELELFPEAEELDLTETKFDDAKIEAFPSEAPEEPFEAPFEAPPMEEIRPEDFQPGPETEVLQPEEAEEEVAACPPPKVEHEATSAGSLTDLRIIGFAVLLVGIIGAVVMLNIRWFWLWVPSIGHNMLPFSLIGVAIIVVAFILYQKTASDSRKGKAPYHPMIPSVMLALILFGFISVILFILAVPINNALKSSQIGVSTIFIVMVVVGLVVYILGSRSRAESPAETA